MAGFTPSSCFMHLFIQDHQFSPVPAFALSVISFSDLSVMHFIFSTIMQMSVLVCRNENGLFMKEMPFGETFIIKLLFRVTTAHNLQIYNLQYVLSICYHILRLPVKINLVLNVAKSVL